MIKRQEIPLWLQRRVLLAVGWVIVATGSSAADELRIVRSDASISIFQNDTPVVVYNIQAPPLPQGMNPVYRRTGFLHPVASPAGLQVTDAFPVDHPHQSGIFSAWVKTSYDGEDVDFWNLAGGSGRVLHERVVSLFERGTAKGFVVELIHRKKGKSPVDVLRERWTVTVHPTDGSFHCFDLATLQTALTDRPLIVRKHHYGGMALRGPTRWLTSTDNDEDDQREATRYSSRFVNNLGSDRLKGNHQRAKWVALTGTIDDRAVTIAVLSHADNFRAPQAARLHPTKPYFCFAPCVDGQFRIDAEHPYAARYRYLVTDAAPDQQWLDQQWDKWSRR